VGADVGSLPSVYQPLDATLTAYAGQNLAADKLAYGSGADAASLTDFTAAARALLDDADAAAMQTTLGVSYFGAGVYGNGADGAVTFDGSTTILGLAPSSSVYTLTRDLFLTDCTINSGVSIKTNGFRLFCSGTLTGADSTSIIHWNGNDGSGTARGAETSNSNSSINTRTTGNAPGTIGANGGTGAGAAGTNASNIAYGGVGGAGGAGSGGAGGAAGTITNTPTSLTTRIRANFLPLAALGFIVNVASAAEALAGLQGGTGGGAGGGDGSNLGGGSGAGGGICIVIARKIAGTGCIRARGGAGGNTSVGNTGGGGPGGGGVVFVISQSVSAGAVSGWTIDANAGTPGTKTGTGVNGSAGSSGSTILLAC